MASTITVFDTINWASSYLEQQPLQINGLEPARSAANLVLQTILGPPFAWPWNRDALTFTAGEQDTTVAALNAFGFLEGGSVKPVVSGKSFEVMVKNLLQVDTSTQARAVHVSPLIDDGQGNITFRLSPAPDQDYNVSLIFQKKAPIIYSLAQTWSPIPDEKNYMVQWGFLSLMSLIGYDARFNEYNTKFITSVLGQQGGLSDLEKNIFIANWVRVQSQLQGAQLGTAERFKAREV